MSTIMNIHTALGAGLGFVLGAFFPSVMRKIKSWFSKESTVVKADIKAEAVKVESKL